MIEKIQHATASSPEGAKGLVKGVLACAFQNMAFMLPTGLLYLLVKDLLAAAYFDRTRAAIVDTRSWTKQQLEARGFAVLDSRSNFLFASTDRKDGGTLYKELKQNGILVRHFDAPRIANWLRITIGTPEQMQALVETLDKILEE